jgi:peroxin-2
LSKRGKYASLPESQCAICAENAAFNLNPSDPSNAFTALAATSIHPEGPDSDHISSYPIYIPYITNCGHIYCYHCLAERMIQVADGGDSDIGWECLRCAEEVKNADRYSVEVPEGPGSDDLEGSEYEFSSDLDMYTDMSGSMGSYTESALSE